MLLFLDSGDLCRRLCVIYSLGDAHNQANGNYDSRELYIGRRKGGREGRERKGMEGREKKREGKEGGKKGRKDGEKEGRERRREGRGEGGGGEDLVHFMRHTKTHYISQDTPSSCLVTISHDAIITSTSSMMMPSTPTPMAIELKSVRLSSTASRQPCQFLHS